MDRETTWRQRPDQTTNWAVTLLAAILAYEFSSTDRRTILLFRTVITVVFLGIETQRYRDYDVYRARIRMVQENLFANALDPLTGVEHHDWRTKLNDDFRNPTLKSRCKKHSPIGSDASLFVYTE
nr:DUF2270 domain-containing protein [Haladaptatus halobius]